MMTTLPVGAVIIMAGHGEQEIWEVRPINGQPRAYGGVQRPLVPGETVYRVVWKGDAIEVRRTYVLQAGDVVWEDTGLQSMSGTGNIFVNRLKKRI